MRGSVRDAPREKTLNGVGDLPSAPVHARAPSRLPDPLIPLAEGCQAEKSFAQHRLRPTGVVRENEEETEEEGGKGVCPSVQSNRIRKQSGSSEFVRRRRRQRRQQKNEEGEEGRKEGGREATGTNPHSKNCPGERARGIPSPAERVVATSPLSVRSPAPPRSRAERGRLISRARNALPERELILA